MLDYSCDDLTGASLYGLCHVEDIHIIRKTHEDRKTNAVNSVFLIKTHTAFSFVSSQQGSSYEQLLQTDEQKRRLHMDASMCDINMQHKKLR